MTKNPGSACPKTELFLPAQLSQQWIVGAETLTNQPQPSAANGKSANGRRHCLHWQSDSNRRL
jgi:hypothetical protein